MGFPSIHDMLDAAINKTVSNIHDYARSPGKDFTRARKLPPDVVISFMVAQRASALRDNMMDFFGPSESLPSVQALCRQRQKLLPEAFRQTFLALSSDALSHIKHGPYQYVAADGSTFTYTSNESFSGQEYHACQGGSQGSYAVHLNAMYDIEADLYTDGVIQPVRLKDEYRAFCAMVDSHDVPAGSRAIFLGDRGYCSYNNMAHVIEAGQLFLFRCKDVDSKGLLRGLALPNDRPVDTWVTYALTRTHGKDVLASLSGIVRYIDRNTSFDYIEHGSAHVYRLTFRVTRFLLENGSWECVVSNLPQDEFPPERLRETYNRRWSIESSFRKLKYTLGTLSFHTYKPELVMQEIWAGLTAYDLTSLAVSAASMEKQAHKAHSKNGCMINFSAAAHIVRLFLRSCSTMEEGTMLRMLSRHLIPVRPGRKFPRLSTAHFRRPKYILYRPA